MTLRPIPVQLTLQGDPTDVEVRVAGQSKGRTPLTLELPARKHTLELRKEGMQDRSGNICHDGHAPLYPEAAAPPRPSLRGEGPGVVIPPHAPSVATIRSENACVAGSFRISFTRPSGSVSCLMITWPSNIAGLPEIRGVCPFRHSISTGAHACVAADR
ncbi:MAG: PEGA domain-containing protein [Proteobacteria bacterium]|nr:PEGA domain-containing protein [Pseudomonadota bacterium]